MFKPFLTDTAEKLSQKVCDLLGEENAALILLFCELYKIKHEFSDPNLYIYDNDNNAVGVAIPIETTKKQIEETEEYIKEIKKNTEKAKKYIKEITANFSDPNKKSYYFSKEKNLYYYTGNSNNDKPQLYRVFTFSQIEELQKQKEQKKLEQQSELYQKINSHLCKRGFF